jgi:hypothetical protein
MEQNLGPEVLPPYVSFATFKTFISDLKEQGVPTRIDRDAWKYRFSGSVGPQLVTALRFLRLIKASDEATEELRGLVAAYDTDSWKDALHAVLKRAYSQTLALNLKEMTPSHLAKEFKEHYKSSTDDVQRKSITFFIHAAKDAGIELSPRLTKNTRTGSPRKRVIGTSRKKSEGADNSAPAEKRESKDERVKPATVYETLIEILDPEKMDEKEQEAIWTLIRFLKKEGKT